MECEEAASEAEALVQGAQIRRPPAVQVCEGGSSLPAWGGCLRVLSDEINPLPEEEDETMQPAPTAIAPAGARPRAAAPSTWRPSMLPELSLRRNGCAELQPNYQALGASTAAAGRGGPRGRNRPSRRHYEAMWGAPSSPDDRRLGVEQAFTGDDVPFDADGTRPGGHRTDELSSAVAARRVGRGLALESALAMHDTVCTEGAFRDSHRRSIQAEPCAKVTFWTDGRRRSRGPSTMPARRCRGRRSRSPRPAIGRRKLPSPPR